MYKLLSRIEFYAALMQGKGFGSSTVKEEVARLNKYVINPNLVIDIGGNIGNYTNEILSKYPNANVHIFEPAKVNFEKLTTTFISNKNVKINNAAVSKENGEGNLFSDVAGSGLASLTQRNLDHFGLEHDIIEKIKIIKFEDYWKSELSNSQIDIVKIDVEGHELDVLNGFGEALWKTKLIQFEFGGCNLDTHTTFQEFYYYFNSRNFEILRITPFGLQTIKEYNEIDEFYLTTNFICINKNLL